jgi:acetyl esterase/lipase
MFRLGWVRGDRRLFAPLSWARLVLWSLLLTATGYLVKAEVTRPDLPEGVLVRKGLIYRIDGERRVALDLYRPEGAPPRSGWPALVVIHGGGWRGGDRAEYGRSMAVLARHGMVVASIDYRLSKPGVPSWPKNLEDVRAAVRWLRGHAPRIDVDPARIAALGSSAGGHLAALLATRGDDDLPGPGVPSARVSGAVVFFGPSDLAALLRQSQGASASVELFLGGSPPNDVSLAEASPLTYATHDDPPMLLIHGTDDRRVPLEQSEILDARLTEVSVPHRLVRIEGARHGFGLKPGGRDLGPEIYAFLDSLWNGRAPGGML